MIVQVSDYLRYYGHAVDDVWYRVDGPDQRPVYVAMDMTMLGCSVRFDTEAQLVKFREYVRIVPDWDGMARRYGGRRRIRR